MLRHDVDSCELAIGRSFERRRSRNEAEGQRGETLVAPASRRKRSAARCRPDQARVSSSHVVKGPGTHLLCVGRGRCDSRGLRPPRRSSGCGGVCRDARVHCGLHLRVAPQRRRGSSRCRPGRPRRVVRGLVLERRVDSLLHQGRSRGAPANRPPLSPWIDDKQARGLGRHDPLVESVALAGHGAAGYDRWRPPAPRELHSRLHSAPRERRNPRLHRGFRSTATGIRTPVSAVRGRPGGLPAAASL
jgi:hypothetical protein